MSYDSPPHFNWLLVPEEREHCWHVNMQLTMLWTLEAQFRNAVRLYDHTDEMVSTMKAAELPLSERADVSNWKHIAGHYAILMIYHFRDALHSVKRNLEQTTVLQSKVHMKTVARAIEEFGEHFPHARELRDQVGHFVDKIYSPEKLKKNRPVDTAYLHGTIEGRTRRIVFAHEGKEISQQISYAEAERLRRVKLLMYSAFEEDGWPRTEG